MKRVFISYSHDSDEHRARVHAFAARLRRKPDISVVLDSDTGPGGPAEGWPQWSERRVIEADVVLAACTSRYRERYEGNQPIGEGYGAVCEARAIRQFLYDCAGVNLKVRVLLFTAGDKDHIPTQLKAYHAFRVDADYGDITAWLRGDAIALPVLGQPGLAVPWPGSDAAYLWPLADRRDAFALFEKAITGQMPKRILLIRGPSNTGKTALTEALTAYAKHLGVSTASFDFKGCPSLDELMEGLKLDLGAKLLPQAYKASGASRFFHLIADLQQVAMPLLLVLDTWQQASQEAQDWVEKQLLFRLDKAPCLVVVLAGQRVPEPASRPWGTLAVSCDLQPIQQVEDWLTFVRNGLQCTGISGEQVATLIAATRGDPGHLSALLTTLAQSAPAAPAAKGGA